jgi:RHH-type proline utilization regulon transcriptional repressor/proline dehydrogenase/delta 1-pyrroline-5-carboxylate dehydrogenase
MENPHFKTQLFRYVDVLPTLPNSREIVSHLNEYLADGHAQVPEFVRLGIKATSVVPWMTGPLIKSQVTGMAHQFMIGNDSASIRRALKKLHDRGVAFTVDVLGEAVLSESEAEDYAKRYLSLLDQLAGAVSEWGKATQSNVGAKGVLVPAVNLSIKVSALAPSVDPTDPNRALEKITGRLRPILRRAKQVGALINFDMESHAQKDLVLALFKKIFQEAEFQSEPACGLAMQAYLRDTEEDLNQLAAWARSFRRRIVVRLVKGAYWDYETVIASQRNWPSSVFQHKWETDANFEKLSYQLLQQNDVFDAAFGTHNARSIAAVLAQAQDLGLDKRSLEFQMLYGMAEPLKDAVLAEDCRLREYCPVGELLPGMAYLVRRLLENTSNEGFLASKFAKSVPAEVLLQNPRAANQAAAAKIKAANPLTPTLSQGEREKNSRRPALDNFRNEPATDFAIARERAKFESALKQVRSGLGQKHPLVINNQRIPTVDWLASLNPADQREIIGYAAQASTTDAERAIESAKNAQRAWARTPACGRAAKLERVADLMRRDKKELAALEVLEAGKSWVEADADITEAIDFCNFYAAAMHDLHRPRLTQHVAGETNHQHWLPRGVGVVISPWNFPLAILTGMTAAAVAAGNSVIMKPSEQTPIIAASLMDLFIEAGIPPGVVNLLTGSGSTIGSFLVDHPAIDFVAFTGSKEVGLKIWEISGRTHPGQANLKKVVCEMGGKNALIVDNDADMDEAVSGCLASAFGYSGQKCSALSRLILLKSNSEKFLERLTAAAAALPIGSAETPGTVIVPVISRAAQQRILEAIEHGKREATLIWQGRAPEDPNACYVPPAIFTNVPPTSDLFRKEIFGPVLWVTVAQDFKHAINLANDCEFALTGGCYSRSPQHIEQAKADMICGNLYINRPTTGAIVQRQPFGGFKMSGGGTKAGGVEYIQNFMVPRVITENCLRRGFDASES